jgi:ATP-binding cassette subfamily C protein LapB
MEDYKKVNDPLLSCLITLTKIDGRPFSAESLTSGLPLSSGESWPTMFSTKGSAKSNFSRAAKRAGYTVKLLKRPIIDMSSLVLPAIMLLKNQKACILTDFSNDRKMAKIVLPELEDEEKWVKIEDLEEEYIGFTFLLKKEYTYDEKVSGVLDKSEGHWFWSTLFQSSKIYYNVIIASIVINLFVLASPLFTMNVYDRVVPNNAIETLWVFAIGVSVVYVLDIFLKFVRTYFLELASKKSDVIMSSRIFEKVMNLKMEHFPRSIGSFASNLKEFDHINSFFSSSTLATIVDLPFAILFLFVIYIIGGSLVVVPVVVMFLIILYSLIVKNPLNKSIENVSRASANKNSILIEALNNIETIKTLGASGLVQWEWEESTGEISKKSITSKLLSNSIATVTSFLIQLNTVAIVVYGVYLIQDALLSMGGLIAVVILSGKAISPMGRVAGLLSNYEYTKTSYDTINDIMSMPVERVDNKKYVKREKFSGDIEFKKVSFSYPDEIKEALSNVSFKIKPGEKVAIIGRVGSGKTTLGKLAVGLYQPNSGHIYIDGIEITQMDPSDIRQNIGYVSQEVFLFKGTIKENILYKAPYVDDTTLIEAIKVSGAAQYINEHPKGFDMPIYEKGTGLSGGQKQSIALARILLNEPAILILDEPTSGMDNTTETLVKNNLKQYAKNKTLIVVTHKSSMLDIVDRIIVVDKGGIALDGAKEDVIAQLTKG